uniref:Secreted protein n=1 Tax=uncultured marine group II/III euryarchaeote SAT1000_18_E10 TaxID=1456565 RepID=A0A075I555_9EURY|nr:Secreted protein [uncultured marine group II/III euryarchaeote SAT1000_18_E10]
MAKKIDVFGKTLKTPRTMLDLSAQPEPFGGIPSGVFAVFAVIILGISLAFYIPNDAPQDTGLTAQSEYLENILSDRSRSSPTLSTYDSCGYLEIDLKDHLKEEMRVSLGTGSYYYGGWGMVDDMVMVGEPEMAMDSDGGMEMDSAPSAGPESQTSSGGEKGVDFSGTNNQELGVDEADFVKTDGSYIYLVNQGYSDWGVYPSGKLHILEIPEVGDVSYLSNISIEGYPNEMLLVGDKAVIYSNVYIYSYYEEKHPLDEIIKTEVLIERTPEETSPPEAVPEKQDDDSTGEGKEESSDDEIEDEADSDDKEDLDENYEYDYYYRTTSFTKLTVLDLTNRSSPQVIRELYIEGNYQTARESEGTVRMVSYGWMEIYGLKTWLEFDYRYWDLDWESSEREKMWMEKMNETIEYNDKIIDSTPLDNLIPRIYEKSGSNITTHRYSESGQGNCQNFAAAADGAGQGVTSILTLDLLEDTFSFNADHILSNWATVYASGNVMIMAESAWDSWWFWGDEDKDNTEMTNLHVFDISSPGQTNYIASGRVNGTIQDQFSISEYNGNIRVCSTTGQWGRWWMEDPEPMASHVFVLGLNTEGTQYDVIGHVGGIAEDEQIWSARFIGDKAYLVTFRNIDPLWTIDLSEPTDPRVIGELEVPGVSTYIHPMGDDHLLTIGIAGDEDGLDWGVTQISIFDVSDFSNPVLESSLRLTPAPENEYDWSYSYSEATYEHKAFQYWEADGLLAIPMSTQRYYSDIKEIDGRLYYASGYEYISKLMLINAKPGEDLAIYDEIDHSSFYNSSYSWDSPDVRRSIFMGGGDYIYAISEKGVTAHNVDTMEITGFVELPSDNRPDYVDYYYGEVVDAIEAEPEEDGEEDRDSDSSSDSEDSSTGSEG